MSVPREFDFSNPSAMADRTADAVAATIGTDKWRTARRAYVEQQLPTGSDRDLIELVLDLTQVAHVEGVRVGARAVLDVLRTAGFVITRSPISPDTLSH